MYTTPEVKTIVQKQNKTKPSVGWRGNFLLVFRSELVAGSPEKHLEKSFYLFPFLYVQLPKPLWSL